MRAKLRSIAVLLPAGLMLAAIAHGQFKVSARATVTPGVAKIGERVIYRGEYVGYGIPRFLPPEPDSALTWGTPRITHVAARLPERRWGAAQHLPSGNRYPPDTFRVEVPLQAFVPGVYTLPGLRFLPFVNPSGKPDPGNIARFPQVMLVVASTLTAADSTANLKDVHGPLKAPWWERVPWLWIAVALLLIAAIVWLVRRLRRRKPKVVAPAPVAPAPRRDPVLEALTALEALRRDALPEAGRFAEHAYELGRILRRFLEATTGVTRPGDTTPELIGALRASDVGPDDIQRLSALLRGWDLVKFAREPVDAASAHRHEDSVEAFVRASAAAARKAVA